MQIFVPTQRAEDWKRLLARESHWKEGYSAMALAHCWEEFKTSGGPPEVLGVLGSIRLIAAMPEYKVDLPPKGGRASQTDLMVIGREAEELVIVAVEGKVEETFGPTLQERRADPAPGVKERIRWLLQLLHLPPDIPGGIRYQLLHRTAAAILAATEFNARVAVMLVHSFSQHQPNGRWFEDFQAYSGLFNVQPSPGTLCRIGTFNGVDVRVAWCKGDARFLKAVPSGNE